MSLTFTNLIEVWNHATGADESSRGVSVTAGINMALSHLSSMHEWEGLIRSAIPVASVLGQSYVDLPVDCAKIISIQYQSGFYQAIEFTDLDSLAQARTANQSPDDYAGGYLGSVSWRVGPYGATPVIDVYPNIGETLPNTFRLTYRARLLITGSGEDPDNVYLPVPPYLEPLIIRLVSLFAKGQEEEDEGTLEARLELLSTSRFFYDVMTADGHLQPELGRLRGGAAQSKVDHYPWRDEDLAEPS